MSARRGLFIIVVASVVLLVGGSSAIHARVPAPALASRPELLFPAVDPLSRLGGDPFTTSGFTHPSVVGSDIPIYEADNEQYLPSVAYNWRHDEYLVVWHNLWGGGGRDVYARRISGQGEILSWFAVAHGVNDRAQPSVAYDSENDRYLVVWIYDRHGDGSDWNVYGRFVPWDGPDAAFYEFPICTWSSDQRNPRVVYNENPSWSEFLVVWWNTSMSSVPAYVSARRVFADASGFPPGDGFTVASDADLADDYLNPDVAYNLARNEYLVVYEKNSYDILATRVAADGNVLGGGAFNIATWPDSENLPAVAACYTADQYFVAWQSLQNSTHYDIYGRFVKGDGTTADVLHITDWIGAGHETNPDVTCDADAGHYLVTWEQQYLDLSGPYGIWGRLIHVDKTQDAKFEIAENVDPYNCWQPAVASGRPSYMVAWEHQRSGTTYQDIHGRLVTPHALFLPLLLRRF